MKNKHLPVIVSSIVMIFVLSGCLNLLAIPTTGVNAEGEWIAFLESQPTDTASAHSLKVINRSSGVISDIGFQGEQQGAFAWHPDGVTLAYYNLSFDGVPSIKTSTIPDDTAGYNLFGPFALPTNFYVTQMAYSPDGAYLAMRVILLPEQAHPINDISRLNSGETSSLVYLADLNGGTVNAITDPAQYFPSSLAWNPDGTHLAYGAYTDSNANGQFDIGLAFPPGRENTPTDEHSLYIYTLTTQSVISIENENTINVSPAWLNENELAYITWPLPESEQPSTLQVFNLTTSEIRQFKTTDSGAYFLTLSTAPDYSRLAYTVAQIDLTADLNLLENRPVTRLYLASMDDTAETLLYEYNGTHGTLDTPVWMPDSTGLILSTGNPLATQLSMDAIITSPDFPAQSIFYIELNGEDSTTVYEGTLLNSGIVQFNLASESPDS